jgi:hypothetical protein
MAKRRGDMEGGEGIKEETRRAVSNLEDFLNKGNLPAGIVYRMVSFEEVVYYTCFDVAFAAKYVVAKKGKPEAIQRLRDVLAENPPEAKQSGIFITTSIKNLHNFVGRRDIRLRMLLLRGLHGVPIENFSFFGEEAGKENQKEILLNRLTWVKYTQDFEYEDGQVTFKAIAANHASYIYSGIEKIF